MSLAIGAMGAKAPVKKAPNAPTPRAAIGNAGGELRRAGAGGSMSLIRAMGGEKFVPGSAQGVLPVKGDIIEALWTEDDKAIRRMVRCGISTGWATWVRYRPGTRSVSGI
jgi:hypothetical protein